MSDLCETINHHGATYHFAMLEMLSKNMAIRFNAPVYLVGSFVSKPIHECLDVDLIMPLSRERFKRIFRGDNCTDTEILWRFKQKEYYENSMPDVDIDFKAQLLDQFLLKSKNEVIIRLDGLEKLIASPKIGV